MIARTPAARSFVEVIFILGVAVVIPDVRDRLSCSIFECH